MEPGFLSSIRSKLSRVSQTSLMTSLFVFAFLVRLAYLMEIRETDFFSILVGDGHVYDAWALAIQDNWLGNDVFYQAPLYPYFLAAIYSLFGHDFLAVRVIQMALGSAACVLLALAGRLFFSARIGLLAGFLLAIYAPAIFFEGLIQKASLDLFFMTALLFLLGKVESGGGRRWPMLAGFVLGCLALTRENALVLLPIIVLWLLWRFRKVCSRQLSMSLFFFLGTAFVLAPVAARNAWVGGEFIVTTSQFGPNFYIGNHAGADGKYIPLLWGHGSALLERGDATKLAEKALGKRLTPGEVSNFWTARAVAWIRSHPAGWLKLMGHKWLLVWNDREIPDSDEPVVYEDASLVLALSGFVFSFGTICPLALAGIVATWPDRRRLALLYPALLGIAASTALFFVFARYRYLMVPILVLFAAAGIFGIIQLAREKRPVPLLAYALLIAATAFVCHRNLDPDENPRAMAYYNLAVSLERDGTPEKAAFYYQKALESKPDYVQAHINLGVLLANHGDLDAATSHYREALRIKPNNPVAHNNLGNALSARGDLAAAADCLALAVAAEPDNAIFHNNLARILAKQGKQAEAERHYRLALQIQPDLPQAQKGLADALERKKKPTVSGQAW